jgi:hypothetical protein
MMERLGELETDPPLGVGREDASLAAHEWA